MAIAQPGTVSRRTEGRARMVNSDTSATSLPQLLVLLVPRRNELHRRNTNLRCRRKLQLVPMP